VGKHRTTDKITRELTRGEKRRGMEEARKGERGPGCVATNLKRPESGRGDPLRGWKPPCEVRTGAFKKRASPGKEKSTGKAKVLQT